MKRPFFILAIFLSILIPIFRFFVKEDRFIAGHISNFVSGNPRHLIITGRVIDNPFYQYAYFKKAQIFTISPTLIKVSKVYFPAYGNIRVKSYNSKKVKYGDEILFEAKLKGPSQEGDESLGYRRYLERGGIFAIATISERVPLIITGRKASLFKSLAYDSKNLLKRNIENLFKAPERYLLLAILLGERQDISQEWKDIFIKTQTMHLLAISGLHVAIIASIILFSVGLFGIPQNFKYAITIFLLIFYTFMVGAMPSVVRATVMGVVILSSYFLKREADIYNSLGLAATVILLFNPDQLFDYGFILSFVSVLSIIYLTPGINRAFRIYRIKRDTHVGKIIYYFLNLASASFAVWLGLFPITINFFNLISPISVLINMLAIPLSFIIIALSIPALIFHAALPFLGIIFAEATEFFIAIFLLFLRFFFKMPLTYLEAKSISLFKVILYYTILIIIFEFNRFKYYLLNRIS